MAPRAPVGKKLALSLLDQGKLPIRLGSPHSYVAILEQEGLFRVRQLVADPEQVRAASEQAQKNHKSFMPEHVEALALPTGKIFLEAPSREALRAQLEAYAWPRDW